MTAAILADFKTNPYFHQLREFEISADMPARAWLWQMRSGKSKITIDTACHLYKAGKIDAVVIIAPNGVHENWIRRQLPIHHWDTVERDTLVWRTSIAGSSNEAAKARRGWQEQHDAWWARAACMLKTPRLAWFALNSASMTRKDVRKLIAKIVKCRRVLIIFDESDDFRTPGSVRTKMARALAKRCPYRRILTASVVTNSPLHAFSQFELLEPKALGFAKYGDFKDHYAVYKTERNRKGQSYPVLDHYRNLDELRDRMAKWSSVVLRGDCADLPATVPRTRCVNLTDEQLRIYRELHSQFVLELNGTKVSVGENTAKLIKLQQVTSGFLVDEFKDVHNIPGGNPRLEMLADEVYLSPGKVIIWCQFREDLDRVSTRLISDGRKIVQYHGRVSDSDKSRAIDAFQNDPDVTDFVGQPQSGGRGLDLSAADHIIWYSHTFDAIIREQGCERATAVGGDNVMLTDFVAPGVDEYMLEVQAGKFSIAEDLAGAGMQGILQKIAL